MGKHLVLVGGVQGVQGDLGQGPDGLPSAVHHRTTVEVELGRIDARQGRGHGDDLTPGVERRFLYRLAREVGGGRGIGADVEGREIGVRGVDDDRLDADPEDLCRDLDQALEAIA